MERLRTPLMVNAVYIFLIGLVTLSSSAVRSVFGYEVMDRGVLLVLSGSLLGLGVILWGLRVTRRNTAAYGRSWSLGSQFLLCGSW